MASPFRKDPDGTPAKPASYNTPRPLTAAAVRIDLTSKIDAGEFKQRQSSPNRLWQSESWEYYDAIGEIKYAFNLVANVVSRIRLYAAVVEDPAETPVSVKSATNLDPDLADAAERALSALDSSLGGQAGLLRDAALNLSVAGECYLVQVPASLSANTLETWDIRSVDEVRIEKDETYTLYPSRDLLGKKAGDKGVISLNKNAFVGRLWRSHPRFSNDPDSSLKGILDLCAELLHPENRTSVRCVLGHRLRRHGGGSGVSAIQAFGVLR